MGLGAAFEIGTSGLRIYQVATEVVSENIANVNTAGYSRQKVNLETSPPSTHNGFPLGTGVRISSVERVYDSLLQKQRVDAGTITGYDAKRSEVLQQIEPVFNEIAQDGLGASIKDFFNSWQSLSNNPSGRVERQTVLTTAQVMIDQFRYVKNSLSNTIAMQDAAIPVNVDKVNQLVSNIATMNAQIRTTEIVSGNANEMRDQRDDLIRQLGEKIGISFTENNDGTTDVSTSYSGLQIKLVSGIDAAVFSTKFNPVTERTDIYYVPAGSSAPRQPIVPAGGTIGSIITLRDQTIPNYLRQVDQLAYSLANEVNTQHQKGYDLTDSAGGRFFSVDSTTPPDNSAASITLLVSNPDKVAAANQPGAPGNNANALAIARLVDANTMSSTTTFAEYYETLVAQIGLDVQTAASVYDQDKAFMKQLNALRDSKSGVSLDEELTQLMKYQRSYQASAKLISTAGEMMDIAIAMMR